MIKFVINATSDFDIRNIQSLITLLNNEIEIHNAEVFEEYEECVWKLKVKNVSNAHYFIELEKKTFDQSIQLIIDIIPQRLTDDYDLFLEKMKVQVKKHFLKNWNESQAIWLDDQQSLQLSQKLYNRINEVENRLRSFINIVMNTYFGTNWWNNMAPHELKLKHKGRMVDFKRTVKSFNDVADYLISIDVSDLIKIMKLEIRKWTPEYSAEIEQAILSLDENKLFDLLKNK